MAWIGLCMGIVFATVLGGSLNLVLGAPIAMPTYGFWQSIINFLALLGLGYALLRHRVFDFGFAVNRALVFGIASAILLLAFFSLEKLAEYFLHVEGREQNALLDGAIALGVFLFFHRVRHGVEHYLERLLFSQWHNNEKALRHFVKQAAHITQSDALLTALTAEVDRFTSGAGNATYRRNADGHFERAAGTLEGAPEILDANDPLVVALRADHQPTRCEDTRSSLPAEIALPMSHRAELDGFILVGGKLNKENYRPDEIELLNFAANQVGLDLHALEAEEFKREVAEHERKASELAREAAVLRSNNEDMRALVERALAAQSKA